MLINVSSDRGQVISCRLYNRPVSVIIFYDLQMKELTEAQGEGVHPSAEILAPCVTTDKLLNLSEPQSPLW